MRLFGFSTYEDERKQFNSLLKDDDDDNTDEKPDYVEGIFFIP